MKKVSIEWIDSYSTDKWMENADAIDQFKKLMTITSLGMILYDDDKCIVLCQSIEDNNVCGLLHIPKVAVVKITEINDNHTNCLNT